MCNRAFYPVGARNHAPRATERGWGSAACLAILVALLQPGCRAEELGPDATSFAAQDGAGDSVSGALGDTAMAADAPALDAAADAALDPGPASPDAADAVSADAVVKDLGIEVDAPHDGEAGTASEIAGEVTDDVPDAIEAADATTIADAEPADGQGDGAADTADDIQTDSGGEIGLDAIACSVQACDDGKPCTDDTCGPTGCQHVDNALVCDDGSPCTAGDKCTAGACIGIPQGGCCKNSGDCGDKNPCTVDSCDVATGTCKLDKVALAGLSCDSDSDGCTPETCTGGVCVPGAKPGCAASGKCSVPTCTETADHLGFKCESKNMADASACSDNDACTQGDACAGGVCVPGTATDCNDANACTGDTCNASQGCVHADKVGPCSDGDACTNESCVASSCAATATNCDDADSCTADSCDKKTGACVHTPLPCQKPACLGDAGCGKGVCDPALHACVACVKDSQCGAATPICQTGLCIAGKLCQSAADCKATGQVCDDKSGHCVDCLDGGDCAANQVCLGQLCLAKTECTGDKACTSVCAKGLGFCVTCNVDKDCGVAGEYFCGADHACHAQVCQVVACAGGQVLECKPDGSGFVAATSCDDGNVCTEDFCALAQGCLHPAVAATDTACQDGSACTGSDVCAGGACKAGAVDACNDADPCTQDACALGKDCVHVAVTVTDMACEDGDACTVGDVCVGKTCKGGAAKKCDDGDACTLDLCVSATGCKPVPAQCGDGQCNCLEKHATCPSDCLPPCGSETFIKSISAAGLITCKDETTLSGASEMALGGGGGHCQGVNYGAEYCDGLTFAQGPCALYASVCGITFLFKGESYAAMTQCKTEGSYANKTFCTW